MGEDAVAWLTRLLDQGESVQHAAPNLEQLATPAAMRVLRRAFARHLLTVAGPPLPFVEKVAVAATGVVALACWRLVSDPEPSSTPLRMSQPTTAADHLSADVLLRFLPPVLRRARAHDDIALTTELEAVLCAWPLSGVLGELEPDPTTDVEFGEHPGLQLLYAERLGPAPRAAWVPASGQSREWAERVFATRGRTLPSSSSPATGDAP